MKIGNDKMTVIIALVAFALCAVAPGAALAAKKKTAKAPALPPYKAAGTIPGTALSYERLFVAEDGSVSVMIRNPERSGVRFRATFSFYSAKNVLLTGFQIEGTAAAVTLARYSLKLPDHKKMKDVSYMTVLGRSGRTGGDDWE
ncbi:MAG: hypothetical protein LBL73_12050 [Synergistaceae bacterium]|nr:hypothetical protein [Synergistaceae bacterium]